MKSRRVPIVVLAVLVSLGACEKTQAPEPKAAALKPSGATGYVINFKPNDSPDLVPAKTVMLVQSPAQGKNNFCLDVHAKAFEELAEVSFTLNFDPALVEYQSFQPGTLFEPKGNVAYQAALLPEEKGKLSVRISFETGTTATGGTGKAVILCFKAKDDGRSDVTLDNGQVLDAKKTRLGGVNWVSGLLWVLTG
jgi:hypothetical protein